MSIKTIGERISGALLKPSTDVLGPAAQVKIGIDPRLLEFAEKYTDGEGNPMYVPGGILDYVVHKNKRLQKPEKTVRYIVQRSEPLPGGIYSFMQARKVWDEEREIRIREEAQRQAEAATQSKIKKAAVRQRITYASHVVLDVTWSCVDDPRKIFADPQIPLQRRLLRNEDRSPEDGVRRRRINQGELIVTLEEHDDEIVYFAASRQQPNEVTNSEITQAAQEQENDLVSSPEEEVSALTGVESIISHDSDKESVTAMPAVTLVTSTATTLQTDNQLGDREKHVSYTQMVALGLLSVLRYLAECVKQYIATFRRNNSQS